MGMYVVIAQARVVCDDYYDAPQWKRACIDDMLRGKLAELMTSTTTSALLQEPSIIDASNCQGACTSAMSTVEQDIGSTLEPVSSAPTAAGWQNSLGGEHRGDTRVVPGGTGGAWGANLPSVKLSGVVYTGSIFIDFVGSGSGS